MEVKDEYDDDKRKINKAFTNKRLTGTVTSRLLKLAGSDRKNSNEKYKILFDKVKSNFTERNYLINNVIVISDQDPIDLEGILQQYR